MPADTTSILGDLTRALPSFAAVEASDPETYPAANIAALQDLGVLTAPFSAALGGSAATLVDATRMIEAIATASPSTALVASMPLGLAGVCMSALEATPAKHRTAFQAQVEQIAADYRARAVYAACNSEKGAGGSLAATQTVAARAGAGFALTGEKILASSGRYARYFFSTAKVRAEDLPGAGIVEFFLVRTDAPGVEILSDWDGFGMRSTESQTVRYTSAPAEALFAFPNFIDVVKPTQYWACLFAAIPLGCAAAMLKALATPAPASPALRLRFTDALMRYEALRAYLLETASAWAPAAPAAYQARVLRTKTYVAQESTKLCAELFALSGGRHYRRAGSVARSLADSFAGTALRPPLPLALDTLVEQFSLGELDTP